MTTTTTPFASLRIPSPIAGIPAIELKKQAALDCNDTSTGKAYAKRSKQNRFVTKITVDPVTNLAMIDVQYMDDLQPDGKQLTRATIIRRALRLYTRQILQAKKSGRTEILALERTELMKLVNNRKPEALGNVSPCQ
jgi:hypothetical protein